MAVHIYILSFLLEKRKSTHLPDHTPLPGNRNESGCCLSLLAFIFSPSFHAGLYFCYCVLTRYSWRYFLLFFFFPLHVPPELSKSLTPQKERPVRMKSFGHSQVAPHIPSQLFRMMQIGSAGVGVAVALYHRCCWMVAEPAVGHTVSRPFPSVSRKERSETMHFTVSAPSLRPSFHTPYLM